MQVISKSIVHGHRQVDITVKIRLVMLVSVDAMHLLSLPNEILIYMAELFNQEWEIYTLSLVCRRLVFFDCALYRHNIRYSRGSALHWAARYGRMNTAIKVLEAYGWLEGLSPRYKSYIDLSSINGGPTALSIAVQHRNLEIARLLLSAGADPNTQSQPGESLCCCAAKNGHLESLKLLSEQGARFGADDAVGSELLPLLLAAHGRHYAVTAYIWDALQLSSRIGFENE